MADVVIFGVGQLAELAHFYLNEDSPHNVVGFMVDKAYMPAEPMFKGLPVVPFEALEEHFAADAVQLFLPISYKEVNQVRKARFLDVKARGYTCISYISSRATYYDTSVGENCFIFEDNTIQPFTKIGDNVTLWSGNHIGHHTVIEDHCFVTSQVVISGACVVGEASFIGVNATLRDNITVGSSNVIGAGCLILADTQPGQVFVGAGDAARKIPSHKLKGI